MFPGLGEVDPFCIEEPQLYLERTVVSGTNASASTSLAVRYLKLSAANGTILITTGEY